MHEDRLESLTRRAPAAVLAAFIMSWAGCGAEDTGVAIDASPVADAEAAGDGAADLGPCPHTEETYPGPGDNVRAIEANPHRPSEHFLATYIELDENDAPDLLNVSSDVASGVDTGTFSLPGEASWTATICVDRDVRRRPICRDILTIARGTLEVTSVDERMVGALTEAVFVDDRDEPTCAVTVVEAVFDAEIECEPEIHCD